MVAPQTLAKAERKHAFFRDVREHRKIEMEKRLKEYNWTSVNNTKDASEASILTDAIGGKGFLKRPPIYDSTSKTPLQNAK
jgi:hypothetical protein